MKSQSSRAAFSPGMQLSVNSKDSERSDYICYLLKLSAAFILAMGRVQGPKFGFEYQPTVSRSVGGAGVK